MSLREPITFGVLGFASTHQALDAEALLEDLGFDVVPIPAPLELTANCGIAIRLPLADVERARVYLERAAISVATSGQIEDV